MTAVGKPEVMKAAMMLLQQMGITAEDLLNTTVSGVPVPTFAEYVPIVAAAVSPGSQRMYSTYWAKAVERWADRRIDSVIPSEIEVAMREIQANALRRRNNRGGRSAAEHFISAMRCFYKRAVADGHIAEGSNPGPLRSPTVRL
ncbi:integrase [Actinoplanes awajinensis]|uniref:Integrase n=1 Tax=Actinoplanes awajinensis subsp. mycoplanecinus TaxID=135947 RepID=A0A101JJ47_9ACTN|nr:integrase [Actinoplanes awajinensis]KUL27748.1 integrase [Actinoplanes awajinensis subsp. mycoplanecinus]